MSQLNTLLPQRVPHLKSPLQRRRIGGAKLAREGGVVGMEGEEEGEDREIEQEGRDAGEAREGGF